MDVLRRIQRIVLVLFIKYLQTDWRGERCLPRPPCNDMPCFWWGEYFVRFFLFDLRLFVGEKETRDFMSNTLCYFWSSNDFWKVLFLMKKYIFASRQEGDIWFMCWKINDFYNVSVVHLRNCLMCVMREWIKRYTIAIVIAYFYNPPNPQKTIFYTSFNCLFS